MAWPRLGQCRGGIAVQTCGKRREVARLEPGRVRMGHILGDHVLALAGMLRERTCEREYGQVLRQLGLLPICVKTRLTQSWFRNSCSFRNNWRDREKWVPRYKI